MGVNQRIQLTQNGKRYIVGGVEYDRVTTVCGVLSKPQLEAWKMRVGEEEAKRIGDETSEYGDMVHGVTAMNDLGMMKEVERMLEVNPWLIPHWVAWFDWVGKYVKEIIAVEEVVWSEKMRIAGKIDRVVMMVGDKQPAIVDIKTGSLYDDIGLQLEGYKAIWNEKRKPKVKRTIVVQLPRKSPGDIHPKEYDKVKYKMGWEAAYKLFRSMR